MKIFNLNYCSFCRKVPEESQIIIAGPEGVNLCDKCVDLCTELVAKSRAKTNKALEPTPKGERLS